MIWFWVAAGVITAVELATYAALRVRWSQLGDERWYRSFHDEVLAPTSPRQRPVDVWIALQISALPALRDIQRVFDRAATAAAQFVRAYLVWTRPPNLDPTDRTFQSDVCAGWLHDGCALTGCCCTCHGGTRR